MDIKKQIEEFVPYNEQEEADKKVFLKWLDISPEIFTRENVFAHFTSSNIILNKKRDKVLLIYHNIYDSWGWTGGHADGDKDLLHVALKEAEEETGLKSIRVLDPNIFIIDALAVFGHFKRGAYVSDHIHLNVAYLLEADEEEEVHIKPDENSGVKWIDINEITKITTESHMVPVYEKIINKMKDLGYIS